MRWSPEELVAITGGRLLGRASRPICGAFIDSREPRRDALFVPIVGARDGHAFIGDAVAGGASAVLQAAGHPALPGVTTVEVASPLGALGRLASAARDRCAGPVVAITGSNGKTTTRALTAAALGSAIAPLLCTRGNLNNHLGVPLTLVGEPDAAAAMVIELGMSAPGENDHLARLVRPTHALITSVAVEHLEFMGSIEAIARAEAETIAHVQAGGAVIMPDDEPLLLAQVPALGGPRLLTFGSGEGAAVQVLEVAVGERTEALLGVRLAGGGRERVRVRLAIFGAYSARNAAAALTVGVALDCPLAAMVEALEEVGPVGDRGRALALAGRLVIADCYNANPGSVAAALRSLAAVRRPRRVAVLGDMLELGPTEAALHQEIGALAATLGLDVVLTVGARAREIAAAAAAGGLEASAFPGTSEPRAVAARALQAAGAEGVILVKGSRGMRLERVVAALEALTAAG